MSDATATQRQIREQFTAAGQATQETMNAVGEMVQATAEFSLHATEQSMRIGQELRAQNERIVMDAFATYRRWYEEGLRSWQGYTQSVNGIVNRAMDRQ